MPSFPDAPYQRTRAAGAEAGTSAKSTAPSLPCPSSFRRWHKRCASHSDSRP